MSGYVRDKLVKSFRKHMVAWGKLVKKGYPILPAVQCSPGDACDYKFSDGASNK